jgi:rhamnogalacturonyl hydrolase YesR
MMNLELLFQASLLTGDKQFYNIAVSHANTTMRNHFRDDGSSYHVVDYNPADGSVIKRITHQGLFDESVWSRGQGWGLYGFTMCYRFTHDKAYLEQARKIARFWLSQTDMPDDMVPYWDMRDPAIKTGVGPALDGGCPRDASAAAIIASALYELATYVSQSEAETYRKAADTMVHSLETSYQPDLRTHQGFLLLHSTGNYPSKDEVDVPINYADYYYLEALLRRESMR